MGNVFKLCDGKQKDRPVSRERSMADPEDPWFRLGGHELEASLRKGWVKLVRADYLVRLAESEEEESTPLPRCQDLPCEAVIAASELQRAGSAKISYLDELNEEWLRIIVVSCPWLTPHHPDPRGDSLRLIARVVQSFMTSSFGYENQDQTYGVLIDYMALPQGPRTEQEKALFESSLSAMSLFYSHPHTIVLKVTTLPDDYPDGFDLPEDANTMPYTKRGWCYAESAVSCLAKNSAKVLDLGRLPMSTNLWNIMTKCRSERTPPLHPESFKKELSSMTFTCREADFEKVAKMYADAFQRHLGRAENLDYSGLGWDAVAVGQLLGAVEGNKELRSLRLEKNALGPEGARVVASFLEPNNSSLSELSLGDNAIGPDGAKTLSDALMRNHTLQTLNLQSNNLGDQGAQELVLVFQNTSSSLKSLNLSLNFIGTEGGAALCEALAYNESLTSLDLGRNVVGSGATALGEALQINKTLTSLNLQRNGVAAPAGSDALAEALRNNRTLTLLNLDDNRMGDEGAEVLSKALLANKTLCSLSLENNTLSDKCVDALVGVVQQSKSLKALRLGRNSLGEDSKSSLLHARDSRTGRAMEVHT